MRIGSLCSGYGGLDLAALELFPGSSVWWHCEYEAAPSKILAHHWPGVPNYRDITEIDWATIPTIDLLTAGWPCQPWSVNGKQKGADDERAIWPHVALGIRVLRPRIILLENVPNIFPLGEFGRVADTLAALGYDLRWTCLRASEVGACHGRERAFIVATDAEGERLSRQQLTRRSQATPTSVDRSLALLPTPSASDSTGGGTHPSSRKRGGHTIQLIDAVKDDDLSKYDAAIRRQESVSRPAPSPVVANSNGNAQLNAAFDEWVMFLPEGWVISPEIGLSRTDQIKAIGNGVVPPQAVAAFRYLFSLVEVAA